MLSLTLMRRILPRRSFVFRVVRRSSPVGRWTMPPFVGVVTLVVPLLVVPLATEGVSVTTVAELGVRPALLAVICGWLVWLRARRKNTLIVALLALLVPPMGLVWMLPLPMFGSASSALSMSAPVAFHAIGAVVWLLKVSVNVPPVALLTRTVCCSSVSSSSNGP